ncbi:receptor-interacting serine/threonine-protein kinase 2-like [Branchiostoma floridae]|uniref:Receptor-interacting serine/threonine-protein kinase 2-like n=1 Tax=Branchiostoma floridae TaxID=7739 RepID=A0A9J7N658_BRAFL|nr:receptor-interacting serine/threonine-protein kinase 2-like [Branchiostoma floridae]
MAEERVLQLLRSEPKEYHLARDIASRLGIAKNEANNALYALKNAGKVKQETKKPPTWRAVVAETPQQLPLQQPQPQVNLPPAPSDRGQPPQRHDQPQANLPPAPSDGKQPPQQRVQPWASPAGNKAQGHYRGKQKSDETKERPFTVDLPIVKDSQLVNEVMIGVGGFASVNKAFHTDWQIDIAVKTLHVSAEGEKALLYSEVKKMLLASTSPHIVDICGICLGSTSISLVMTYMENGSLKSLLKRENVPLPWAIRWRIAHEIALGLNFLHCLDPQIIHCDMKAENVLLDKDFHAKISDFGIAKWRKNSELVKSVSPMGRTPTHAPPECFAGQEPNTKFDVYSFGITLWEILARKEPFQDGPANYMLASAVRSGQRPERSCFPSENEVSGMVALTYDCWENIPQRRPTMKEVCSRLARGCANYTEIHMLEAIIAIKKAKDKEEVISKNGSGSDEVEDLK